MPVVPGSISKKDAKVCIQVAGAGRRKTVETVTTWSSMTSQILALREHLIAERITCAVMEATGDYWKPFYYLLEDAGFEVLLMNSRHVKNLPGRKTDVADAAWLARTVCYGPVCTPGPIRQPGPGGTQPALGSPPLAAVFPDWLSE